MNTLRFLYLDFDSFFASAEQHLRPELAGRPVAVVPVFSNATCAIAASKEAKRFGIKTGTMVQEARRLCPEVVFVEARPPEYVKLHKEICAVVESVVPIQAVRSIDEMVCRLLANERERALDLGLALKQALARKIGERLTCSIGFAPTELLAKIAAEMDKPNGLTLLPQEALPGRLLDLKLTDLPGIGSSMQKRLYLAGIIRVEQLWNLPPKQMRALWRSVEGERFWAELHGISVERPPTTRGMFGHSRVLAWNWRNRENAYHCARLLTIKAARRMRREGYQASTFIFYLKTNDGRRWAGEKRLPQADDDRTFLEALKNLYHQALSLEPFCPKKIGVVLSGLSHGAPEQDLFPSKQEEQRARWRKIAEITDSYAKLRQTPPLTLGVYTEPPGNYAGAKIAFGRIPTEVLEQRF